MAIEKVITKFSIGTFKNGAYSVFGIVKNGVLKGIIIKTKYPILYKKFSFIELQEFKSEKDLFPQFLKKLNFLTKIKLFFKSELYGNTHNAVNFMYEVCDLPSCAFRYGDFIEFSKRNVLFEKYSKINELSKFVNLNAQQEFELIKIAAGKYGNNDIVNVYHDSIPLIHRARTDLFEKDIYCPVKLYSYHNKNLFVVFRTYHLLAQIYESYISVSMRQSGIKEGIEKIIKKNV